MLRNDPYIEATRDAAPDGIRAEIIHGALLMSPAPRVGHQHAVARLNTALMDAQDRKRRRGGPPVGWVFVMTPELHLGPMPDKTNPDVAGWRVERAPKLSDYPITIAPDWVCEVLSESTEATDRSVKLPMFAGHGVAHAWLVDPETQRLEVYRNERGVMREIARFEKDALVVAEPFTDVEIALASFWAW